MTPIPDLIREGREKLEKATPGPWEQQYEATFHGLQITWKGGVLGSLNEQRPYENAALIVWMRSALPALLDALEAAQRELASVTTGIRAGTAQLRDEVDLAWTVSQAECDALRTENARLRVELAGYEVAKDLTDSGLRLENELLRRVADAARDLYVFKHDGLPLWEALAALPPRDEVT